MRGERQRVAKFKLGDRIRENRYGMDEEQRRCRLGDVVMERKRGNMSGKNVLDGGGREEMIEDDESGSRGKGGRRMVEEAGDGKGIEWAMRMGEKRRG